jgi:hypothetical protein
MRLQFHSLPCFGYFSLPVIGAGLALWQAGIRARHLDDVAE